MHAIRFSASIGEDQTIRPPEGVYLAPGHAEVIVLQRDEIAETAGPPAGSIPDWDRVFSDKLSVTQQSAEPDNLEITRDDLLF
jgi:hypothetical protein